MDSISLENATETLNVTLISDRTVDYAVEGRNGRDGRKTLPLIAQCRCGNNVAAPTTKRLKLQASNQKMGRVFHRSRFTAFYARTE